MHCASRQGGAEHRWIWPILTDAMDDEDDIPVLLDAEGTWPQSSKLPLCRARQAPKSCRWLQSLEAEPKPGLERTAATAMQANILEACS